MWVGDRHQRILALLQAQHRVGTDSLAEDMGVSRETVRRDLLELERDGRIKRVHGGAVLPGPPPEEPFVARMGMNLSEKEALARHAAGLIEPGQCLMIDAGTTTSVFARHLATIPELMVVTNSLDISTTLHRVRPRINVVLLGGRMVSDVPGTYGEITLSEIDRFNVDVTVVSPVALHPEHGATSYDLDEAEVARRMIERAGKVIMLADHHKLGEKSRVRCCGLDRIDVLVTDAGAASRDLEVFRQAGIGEVLTARP